MKKVLHVFYSFLPDLSGASIRSAGLLSGQLTNGIAVVAVSSPFQVGFGTEDEDDFRGVTVYRAHRPGFPNISEKGSSLWTRVRKVALFPFFVLFIVRIARRERVGVVHAHSTFYCALASWIAGRLLGAKVIYEFRSLWEERARAASLTYRIQSGVSRALETLSLRMADAIVTINEGLKSEVVSRGVPEAKVTVVPNAVEDALLELGSTFECPESFTRFGYVGNFSSIEGLGLLVDAFRHAFPCREEAQLLFFGAGAYDGALRRLVTDAGDPRIQVRGSFTRDEIACVYRALDCIVLPRHRTKLNESVTPLKPLEAMAFKRLVCISDVRGLVEVVGGADNAIVFPADDVEQLAGVLRQILACNNGELEIAMRGHSYVYRERAWSAVAAGYLHVYARVLDEAGVRGASDGAAA
jgi:glycogen synthase